MTFPVYLAYKDSGVKWLGEVPEHWAVHPLKRAIERIESGTSVNAADFPAEPGSLGVLKTSCVYTGKFDWAENKTVDDEDLSRVSCPLRKDTLIVSRMNTPDLVGATGLVTEAPNGIFLPDRLWQVYFLVNHSPEFLFYFTKSREYREQVKMACSGTSASMQNLGQDDFRGLLFAEPPKPEQTQIARFLHHETARIDALIEEQQRLIELLKEKRQAVISHAVTKGLDPTVPMKDSGVEWLGEVPAHWEVTKFKWPLRTASGGTPPSNDRETYYDGGIPWLRSLDLTDDLITEREVTVTQRAVEETSCKIVPKSSVLIAMYGGDGTIGKNGLLTFDSAINQAICAFLPSGRCAPEYLHRYIQFYRPYWMIGAESSRKDPNIGQDRIGDHFLVLPPSQEQSGIVAFLGVELLKLSALIKEAQTGVDFLQERRSALISAAVTGKIDVRGWQPPASTQAPESAVAEAN